MRSELRSIAAQGVVPVLFGGEVQDETLHLTEFVGTRTNNLKGLAIPPRSGMGGRVVAQRSPFAVNDYGNSQSITHHFDRPVLSEGLHSILAVPVMVAGKSRAVLYAAIRDFAPIGNRTADIMVSASRRLGTELAIRDEVDRRLQLLQAASATTGDGMSTEEIRDVHAELRSVANTVTDSDLQIKLRGLSQRLALLLNPTGIDPETTVTLTPREVDVLSQVALGCTNLETAGRLSVSAETVKSYLRSAMSKLDAHSRHEAVVTARKLGLLP
ncbi:LuxR C-terminal-related transcriptional regulator [Rhodococcus sp. ARC_M6]|uniref:LuxR C-terminal-related transcriptional regulator n=1 Tax=Rhodococcus sp. ARC_M6 TaxID=2928852 RepID=UPI001FB51726|nr:LuxR C-terminal-related transcriptional regulator [Rhodococcus sp. ARC_M6]MCJ0904803.1 LuxR C-terminal-related transcriptional regulator [Rhodococcus sp. ARC_M6]